MREIKFRAWDNNGNMHYWQDGFNYRWFECENDCHAIMQYTGLKDKNGKEIYEGDIVQRPEPKTLPQAVNFEAGCFIIGELPVPPSLLSHYADKIHVIGNIYENSELLDNFRKADNE